MRFKQCGAAFAILTSTLAADRVKVQLNLERKSRPGMKHFGLSSIEFCVGCPDPHLEGSRILALGSYHGPDGFKVIGDLTVAVPNMVSTSVQDSHVGHTKLMNAAQLAGRVVLVLRGRVSLVEKILAAQDAGAIGVVIADDGNCVGMFECGRAGSPRDGGFSKRDPWQNWRNVVIPAVLVMEKEAERLRNLMGLEKMLVPGLGEQWIDPE